MTVTEYLTELEKGQTLYGYDAHGNVWLEIRPPDPDDPSRGLDEDINPKAVLEGYRMLAAWLRNYRKAHPHFYNMMVAGNPE